MDQERKVETLLKVSKARRLDQAGIPEMHPATLETLRTEVQRQYGNAPAQLQRGLRWYLGFLPKLAVVVALGLCAWLVVLREDSRIPGPLALNQPSREITHLSDKSLDREEPAVGMSFQPSAPRMSPAESAPGPAAPLPASAPAARTDIGLRQKVSRAQTGAAQEESLSVVGADYFKADRQGMYMGIASSEAAGESTVDPDSIVALGAFMETGTVAEGTASRARVLASDGIAGKAVLQDFTVQIDGEVVQIIDADGSIYKGRIRPMQHLEADASRVPSGTAAKSETAASPMLVLGDSTEDPELLNYHLVASGPNRSVDQTVHFMGNLFLTAEQLRSGRPRFHNTIPNTAGRLSKEATDLKNIPTAGRLRGTALLDDGRGVAVDAIPTPP